MVYYPLWHNGNFFFELYRIRMPHYTTRAVYRNFAKGGRRNWGMDKRGGGAPDGSSVVSCEVLHSRGGGGGGGLE